MLLNSEVNCFCLACCCDTCTIDSFTSSESFGLPATADFMFALISSEELDDKNQIMVKQLKNRYNDPTVNRKFILGVDRSKMRFYDVEQNAQTDLVDSGQTTERKFEKKTGQFSDFKI